MTEETGEDGAEMSLQGGEQPEGARVADCDHPDMDTNEDSAGTRLP